MAAGFPAGAVFVDVVPSFIGFASNLTKGLIPPSEKAGSEAGEALSGGLLGKFKDNGKAIGTAFAAVGTGAATAFNTNVVGKFADARTGLVEVAKGFGEPIGKAFDTIAIRAGAGLGIGAVESVKTSFVDHAKDLVAPIAAAIVATGIGSIVSNAITSGIDNELITDRLSASLGATGPQAEKLGKVAGNLYAGAYGDSMEDVAGTLQGILTSGLVDTDATAADLEVVGAQVSNLVATFGEDASSIARAAEQMIRTGLADNATEAFDILTVGFQNGSNKAEDLLDTFNEYGTQFRKLGLDGEGALGLLTQGLQAGARDGDLVADSIKEFSIRAIDGSKATAAGFESIGLNAGDMARRVGAGGASANEALDLTLDRLRAIPDPVQRSQAAVALFGTQAEDLGAALFALDPSEAVAGLGQVAGASELLGTTLNDNASTNIESFKRQLSTLATNVIGGALIPYLSKAATFLATVVGPALRDLGERYGPKVSTILTDVGGALRDAFSGSGEASGSFARIGESFSTIGDRVGVLIGKLPPFSSVVEVAANVFGFLADHIDTILLLLPVFGALLVLQKVKQQLATAAAIADIPVRGAELLVTQAQTAAMNRLSFQLSILTGQTYRSRTATLTALVTEKARAAFTAIHTGITQRAIIVQQLQALATYGQSTAWSTLTATQRIAVVVTKAQAIATRALGLAVRFVLGPVGLVILAITALIGIGVALYKNNDEVRAFIDGAWTKIKNAVSSAIGFLTDTVFPALRSAVEAVGGFFSGLYDDHIRPAFEGAREVVGGVVGFFTGTVFPALRTAVGAVGGFFSDLYTGVIAPVFEFIRKVFEVYVGLIVGYIKIWIAVIGFVIDAIRFLYDNVVAPIFQLIGAVIGAVWEFLRDSVFGPLVAFVRETLVSAFEAYRDAAVLVWTVVRDGIEAAWTFIRDRIFEPVRDFVVRILVGAFEAYRDAAVLVWTVVRDGIDAAWTFIRDRIFEPVRDFLVRILVTAFTNLRDNAVGAFVALRDGIAEVGAFVRNNIFEPIRDFLVRVLVTAFTTYKDAAVGAFNLLRDGIDAVWTFIRDRVFEPLRAFVEDTLPSKFSSAVEAIGKAWDGLKEVAKAPIRFVVNTIINDGLIDGFNSLATKFGTTPIDRLKLPAGFAAGGPIRGAGTGTSDSIDARLSHGEHVWTAREVARAGGHRNVLALRALADRRELPAFAKGGIVDLGKWFQGLGARVTEHPSFGGVHPVHKGRGHYENRAIDVNFGPGGENNTEKAFFDKYAQQVRDMGFKVLWRVAGHFNHLHAEASSGGFLGNITDALGSVGSSIGSTIDSITAPFTGLLGKLGDKVLDSTFGGMVAGAGKNVVTQAIDYVKSKATSLLDFGGSDSGVVGEWDGATGGLSPSAARAAGKSMIPNGWSFGDLDSLWTKESGWSWSADNPGSSAYGIPQALPGKKMSSAGADWRTNAITQIEWGLGYIADRYGDSSKAWQHSKRNNWYADGGPVLSYDSGGYLPPGYTTVHNGTGAPEPIFTRAQADALVGGRGSGPTTTIESLIREATFHEEVDVDVFRKRIGFVLSNGLGG